MPTTNDRAVPTVAVVEEVLLKAGTWSTVRSNDWLVLPTVLVAVIKIGQEAPAPAAGVPERVAVPLPLSKKLTPAGRAPVSVRDAVDDPVVVTENEPLAPTAKFVDAALVMAGAWPTARVRVWLVLPASLTALRSTLY